MSLQRDMVALRRELAEATESLKASRQQEEALRAQLAESEVAAAQLPAIQAEATRLGNLVREKDTALQTLADADVHWRQQLVTCEEKLEVTQ